MDQSFNALPERAIERLFARFAAMYGDQHMRRMWGQQDVEQVKFAWARALWRFDLQALLAGIQALERSGQAFPPSLPEFVALCQQASQSAAEAHRPALPVPDRTAEQIAAGAQQMAQVRSAITLRGPDRAWAQRVLERVAAGDRSVAPVTAQFARQAIRDGE
jgi:hypothetical protein